MDKAITTFYEDFLKVLNLTKKQYNKLKLEFSKVQQEFNLNLNFIFSQHETQLKTDKQKLITYYYLLIDTRLKILEDPMDEEQRKTFNEYQKTTKKLNKLLKQVCDFENEIKSIKLI